MHIQPTWATAALLLAVWGCKSEVITPAIPAALAIVAEPSADARSGIPFPAQPAVELRDALGGVVNTRGLLVTAGVATGGGTLTGTTSARTDDQGRAVFTDLGIEGLVGVRTLRFSAPGLTPALSRSINLAAGLPATLAPAAGNNQTAPAGTAVPIAPAVRIQDAAGNPVPDVMVLFSVTSGGGSVTGPSVASGADGMARVGGWTLGPQVGPNSLTAAAGSLSQVFTATGIVGPAARIEIQAGDAQTAVIGFPVAVPPAVKVTDAFGNPISGVTVTFTVASGGGLVTGATPVTDATGVARVGSWVLGFVPGGQSLSVTRAGVPPALVAAIATDFPIGMVAAGGFSTCALSPAGSGWCWGANGAGQLGNGTTLAATLPTAVQGGGTFQTVALGAGHACGLTPAGEARCWGTNLSGQLGDGTTADRSIPGPVSGGHTFTRIAVGDVHTCALDTAGQAWCWGSNANGRLGNGTTTPSAAPVAVQGGHAFTQLSAGAAHTCGLQADGQLFCWGSNNSGRLGDGTATDRSTPVAVVVPPGAASFASVAAGGFHTCALDLNGAAFCWGAGAGGALGTGNAANQLTAAPVAGGHVFTSLAAGQGHTCGISADGTVRCWGQNANGRLGDGTVTNRLSPTLVAGSVRATALALGAEHTCVRTTFGSAACWGRGLEGQLGDGGNLSRLTAAGVTPP